ncbi:hypothetical protein ACOALA_20090 [Alicyclobacillus acidoterrestris]|uniref:hypothetical protein n=1 Tax=Alicyclobacillus TaxID=29330 RepID=UPI001194F074|nr:hypothetical protein [Alicyclobacillus suci]GEO26959.1 hypothetical protein AAC03nite_27440 [Alicyclobacillus acidoterrestris]
MASFTFQYLDTDNKPSNLGQLTPSVSGYCAVATTSVHVYDGETVITLMKDIVGDNYG